MSSLSYASAGSGPSAGGIGWINLGNFSIIPNTTVSGISVTLLDGSTMTFDLTNTIVAGDGFIIDTISTPVYTDAPFGTTGYTDISGNVGLQIFNPYIASTSSTKLTLSNISVTDPQGNPVDKFTLLAANVETANSNGNPNLESQEYTTNGEPWKLFTWLGNTSSPEVTGLEHTTVLSTESFPLKSFSSPNTITMVGVSNNSGAPVFTTESPSEISATLISTTGLQAVVFGIAITSIKLMKYVSERAFPSDQFNLTILGTPSNTVTTTGSSTGLQPIFANVFGIAGNTYSINESMAVGSFGTLSNYTTTVIWSNLSPDGTIPPNPGALGNNITVALGDVLIATISNTAKSVSPGRGVKFIE